MSGGEGAEETEREQEKLGLGLGFVANGLVSGLGSGLGSGLEYHLAHGQQEETQQLVQHAEVVGLHPGSPRVTQGGGRCRGKLNR